MARLLASLAVIFFLAVGIAIATAADPAVTPNSDATPDPFDQTVMGALDAGADAVAASVGGPVPAGTFPDIVTKAVPAPSPGSGAAALEVTAVAGVLGVSAIAASFFIF